MVACDTARRAGWHAFGAGLLSTFFEYAFQRDQKRAATNRFLLYQPCDEQWWLIARQLGVQLQRARIARGLSQEALAHAAGISTYTYRKFEKGESCSGTPDEPTPAYRHRSGNGAGHAGGGAGGRVGVSRQMHQRF